MWSRFLPLQTGRAPLQRSGQLQVSTHFPYFSFFSHNKQAHSKACIIFSGFFLLIMGKKHNSSPELILMEAQSPLFLVHTCTKHFIKVNLSYFFNKAWVTPEKILQDLVALLLGGCWSTGSCHSSRWDKTSYQWARNQMLKRFRTASENKKCKGFICYLCIIFPLKFWVLLKKISYYVLNLWAELKRSLKTRYDLILTIIPDFPYFTQSLFWSLFWVHLAISHICPFSLSICPFQCCHLVGLLNCLEDAEKKFLVEAKDCRLHQKSFPAKDIPLMFLVVLIFVQISLWVANCGTTVVQRYWQPENTSDNKPEISLWVLYAATQLSENERKLEELI